MKIKSIEKGFLIEDTDISLKDTFSCGQCFRWIEKNNKWFGIVNNKMGILSQCQNGIVIENTTLNEVKNFWIDYLRLDTDYSHLLTNVNADEFLNSAAEYGKGIHILRQDPFETIISFIISSNNNIKRIQKIIETFCKLYGKQLKYNNECFYSFPSIEDLKNVTFENLAELKAGFRDKYIYDAIITIKNEPNFIEKIKGLETKSAQKELMKIKGIGEKVSDCILLFGYDRGEVFPKDVWIKKVITQIYGEDFDEKIYGQYAGIVQQYMFHYSRHIL